MIPEPGKRGLLYWKGWRIKWVHGDDEESGRHCWVSPDGGWYITNVVDPPHPGTRVLWR